MTRVLRGVFVALAAVVVIGGLSCSGDGSSQGPKKVTYRCLVSSCDGTMVCNEGDPVPQHCGKPMIR